MLKYVLNDKVSKTLVFYSKNSRQNKIRGDLKSISSEQEIEFTAKIEDLTTLMVPGDKFIVELNYIKSTTTIFDVEVIRVQPEICGCTIINKSIRINI